MEAIIIAILIFIEIVVIGTLLFGGWVIVSVLRLIGRGIGALTRTSIPAALPAPSSGGKPGAPMIRCVHDNCRAQNASTARFCRRCGKPFVAALNAPVVSTTMMPPAAIARPVKPQSTVARRVAVW